MKNYIIDFLTDNNLRVGEEFTLQRVENGSVYEDVRYRISETYFLIDDFGLPYNHTLELLLKGKLCIVK